MVRHAARGSLAVIQAAVVAGLVVAEVVALDLDVLAELVAIALVTRMASSRRRVMSVASSCSTTAGAPNSTTAARS